MASPLPTFLLFVSLVEGVARGSGEAGEKAEDMDIEEMGSERRAALRGLDELEGEGDRGETVWAGTSREASGFLRTR